jgi:hypothetical protein
MKNNKKNNKVFTISLIALTASTLACSAISNFVATPTPVPTVTPVSTVTPVPTITPQPGLSLFEETEFLRGGCFSTATDEDVERFDENGEFHMQVHTPNLIAWTICDEDPLDGDFVLEADVTTVEGPDNNVAGLVFRFNEDTNEFYNFSIGADGYYVLTKDGLEYTEPVFLVEWNTSSVINQGKTTNHLKVEVIGDTFKYYINDTLVGEVSDSSLPAGGQVGIISGTFDDGNVHVSFDNLKVSKP